MALFQECSLTGREMKEVACVSRGIFILFSTCSPSIGPALGTESGTRPEDSLSASMFTSAPPQKEMHSAGEITATSILTQAVPAAPLPGTL